jgi:F0F1-type ATP synthase membrane subunit c/vacuolar-type H+-ATPase subunit K
VSLDDDPGWGASWSMLLMLVPGGARFYLRSRQGTAVDGLRSLRAIFLGFAGSLVIYGVVLVIIGGGRATGNARPWAVGLAAYGVLDLALVRAVERPLDCASDAALAQTYRTRFFMRVAFAQSVALFGFVAVFVVGPVWLYLLGAAFTAVGYARLAPTRANLGADQRRLAEQGCARSLVTALRTQRPGTA